MEKENCDLLYKTTLHEMYGRDILRVGNEGVTINKGTIEKETLMIC